MNLNSVENNGGNGATSSIRRRTRCPHCWQEFATEDVLWIAESADLFGDSRLGEAFKERFLPIQFDASGAAIDRAGFACRKLACPRCHLTIPRSYLESTPFFFSVAGAPSSGKSYFLTSAIWRLRRVFSEHFDVIFNDSDPDLNSRLIENETSQFLRRDGGSIPKLRKTQELGDEYDSVLINRQETRFLKPFLFSAHLKRESVRSEIPVFGPDAAKTRSDAATIAIYDNAGESFLPAAGVDDASAPVTRHLGRSDALIFVYDPTQDSRFLPAQKRATTAESSRSAQKSSGNATSRTETAQESDSRRKIERSDSFDASGGAFGFALEDAPNAVETEMENAPKTEEIAAKIESAPNAFDGGVSNVRQELVFSETIKRVRENLGIDYRSKYEKPLIVVLSKFDVWRDAVSDVSFREPWARTPKGAPFFLIDRVRGVSDATRRLLQDYLPELVAQAEDFARDVVYLPVSATGESPFFDENAAEWRFDSEKFQPIWAEVPLLYALASARSGLIPLAKTR